MAVIIYNSNERKQLSPHFNVQEFKCKCGRNHEIKIDSKLIDYLEKLMKEIGAEKCIVNSGYRCVAHDKWVGGSGGGQHTKGTAIDAVFYDKSGRIIKTDYISCKAQDLGFPGIANIDIGFTAIHLDTRASGKYYGDERPDPKTGKPNYDTVTNDFYRYYGIKREGEKENNHIVNADKMVKEWQQAAIKDGFSLASGADGIFGNECLAVAKTALCKRDSDEYDNKNLTKIIQKAVGVTVDGLFGKETEKAVKTYQENNGLTVDGIVGVKTWKKILNIK
jgi:hypothetical protein